MSLSQRSGPPLRPDVVVLDNAEPVVVIVEPFLKALNGAYHSLQCHRQGEVRVLLFAVYGHWCLHAVTLT
jgi:hypothetical protein